MNDWSCGAMWCSGPSLVRIGKIGMARAAVAVAEAGWVVVVADAAGVMFCPRLCILLRKQRKKKERKKKEKRKKKERKKKEKRKKKKEKRKKRA